MGKFLETYGVLILAFIGFIQFWLKVLWDKYLRKGEIAYYETGTIVIGYNTSGPTIGLNGTIRALNKDVFIRTIDLLVVREKDKAQHYFKWIAFQSPKIDIAGSQPTPMELPSGFLVSPNSPHRFNIVFNDNELFNDIRPLLNAYYSGWYKTTEELNKIWLPLSGMTPSLPIINQRFEVIERFRKSPIHVDTFTALDRKCYWEQGNYQLIINVTTSKPNKTFTNRYHFSITEADSRILKLNVITILEEPVTGYLRIPNPPYNWAFSEYITK
jgi:hypothetical protein